MEKLLQDLIDFLLPQNNVFLYFFLFASAVVENLFPPIPGDTITAFGAFLVGTGRLDYLMVYISTTLGSVVGFMALFMLGRFLEREFFINKNYKAFSAEAIVKAEEWFNRYGYFIVLANRFLPGIRSVISIVSGISRLKIHRVFLLSLLSASVWNLIWIQAGFMLGNNWDVVKEKIADIMKKYNIAAGIAIAVGVIAYLCYRIYKKKKDGGGKDPS